MKRSVFPSAVKRRGVGQVEPGEVPLARLTGREDRHLAEEVVPRREPAPVGADVVNRQAAGAFERDPAFARQADRVDPEVVVGVPRGEHDFVSRRRPGQSLLAPVALREDRLLPCEVHDGDLAAIVVLEGVLEERDPVPARREARVAEVAARLGEDLAGRELQPVLPADVADHREIRPVRRPVGLAHAVQDLPRRAAFQRHPRERALEETVRLVPGAREDGELSLGRDRKQVTGAQGARARAGIVRAEREDLRRVSGRSRAVDDRLSVRSEPSVEDRLLPERELREGRDGGDRALSLPVPDGIRPDDGEEGDGNGRPPAPTGGRRGTTLARPRGPSRSFPRAPRGRTRGRRADWKRSAGFFSRQCRTSRSSSDGIFAPETSGSGGSSFRIAFIVSIAESPLNARRPVSISKRTHPNAKMSDRASAGCPLTCSGAMYPTVPRSVPGSVALASVGDFVSSPAAIARCLARPKSRIFARPSFVRTTFSGLRSRWTMPLSCAAARPRAIWAPRSTAFRSGRAPAASRWRSVSPSTSSMTRRCRDEDGEEPGISSNE